MRILVLGAAGMVGRRLIDKLLSEGTIAGQDIDDLLGLEAMGWVMDDLGPKGLGYWHDVGRVHLKRCALAEPVSDGLPDPDERPDAGRHDHKHQSEVLNQH